MTLTADQIVAIIGGLVTLVTAIGTTAVVVLNAIAKLKVDLHASAAEVKQELANTTAAATVQRAEVLKSVDEVKTKVTVIGDQTDGLAHAIVESNRVMAEAKGRADATAEAVVSAALAKPAGAL